jgi:alkaline phosphatase
MRQVYHYQVQLPNRIMLSPRDKIIRLAQSGLLATLILAAACGRIPDPTPTAAPSQTEPTSTSAGLPPTVLPTPLTPTQETPPQPPRRIILFIGDGMGANHRQAAAWSQSTLVMDSLAVQGWLKTDSLALPITDSAAATTAMAAGQRTGYLMVAVNLIGQPLETILEQARQQGLSAGLVTNSMISDATPAAFAAHHINRLAYDNISLQLAESGVEVLLGGGEVHFLPPGAPTCHTEPGERSDGRNLIEEMTAAGYTYTCDPAAFESFDLSASTHLLGLFSSQGYPGDGQFPPLEDMTRVALTILEQDPSGFFLMVEGAQIDWASHDNDAARMLAEMAAFDRAVAVGLDFAEQHPDTLIIVAADHETGALQLSREPTGAENQSDPFFTPDDDPFYLHWMTGSHTPANVPVSAQGPGAEMLTGTHHLTSIYDAMYYALTGQVRPALWSQR